MCWKKKAEILGSCGGAYVENGVGLTETLARTCQKPGAVLKAEPSGPGLRRIPPGSARFCRVVPGSAGFRRVPPGSAVPVCAWFRQAGFCRVSANKGSVRTCLQFTFFLPRFRLRGWYTANCPLCYCTLPRFNQVSARIVPSSWQKSARLAAIKEALFTNARTLPKSAGGKIPNKRASLFYFEITNFH